MTFAFIPSGFNGLSVHHSEFTVCRSPSRADSIAMLRKCTRGDQPSAIRASATPGIGAPPSTPAPPAPPSTPAPPAPPGVKPSTREAEQPGPRESINPMFEDAVIFLNTLSDVIKGTAKTLFSDGPSPGSEESQCYEYIDYEGGANGVLPKRAEGLPRAERFRPEAISMLVKRSFEYLVAQLPFIERIRSAIGDQYADDSMWRGLPFKDKFRCVFESQDILPEPQFLGGARWCEMDDAVFARQFINGCNPVVIEHVTSEERFKDIPKEFHGHSCGKGGGSELRKIFEENRLFIADYSILDSEGVADSQMRDASGAYTRTFKAKDGKTLEKFFYAPFVVLYRDEKNGLKVFGIMLNPKGPGRKDIYSEKTCAGKPVTYTFAKMHVACADNQYHQFISHLGLGHLTWEPFSIAYQRIFNLKKENKAHPVGKLLSKHFEGAIAINWLARETLVASRKEMVPLTDAPFAVGASGAIAMLKNAYKTWSFQESSLPKMLKARGFEEDGRKDGLSEYYYRDDGMRLWKALEKYVRRVIEDYYDGRGGDQGVVEDDVLDEWCEDLRERADIKTFYTKFTSKEQLVDAVTTIIFHVSAQHAALNFPQLEYLSYVPNRPNALFKPVPPLSKIDDILEKDVFGLRYNGGASESLAFMHFQVKFAYLLALRPPKTLMNMGSDFPEAYEELKKDLEKLHCDIRERGGDVSYEYMDPYNVPPSINI